MSEQDETGAETTNSVPTPPRPTPHVAEVELGVERTGQIKAVKPKPTPAPAIAMMKKAPITPTAVEEILDGLLIHDGDTEIPRFETDQLTPEMLNLLIAAQLNQGFYRTAAGYVSMKAGLNNEGDVVVSLVHWKSMSFPEQDEVVQASLHLGALVPTKVVK